MYYILHNIPGEVWGSHMRKHINQQSAVEYRTVHTKQNRDCEKQHRGFGIKPTTKPFHVRGSGLQTAEELVPA